MAGMTTAAQRRRGSASAAGHRLTPGSQSGWRSRSPPAFRSSPRLRPARWRGSLSASTLRPRSCRPARTLSVPGGGAIQRYPQRVGGLPVLGAEAVAVGARAARRPSIVSDSTVAGLDPADRSGGDLAAARRSPRPAPRRGAERLRAPGERAARRRPRQRAARLARSRCRRRSRSPTYVVTVDARTRREAPVARHARTRPAAALDLQPEPGRRAGQLLGLKDRNDKDYALLDLAAAPGDARAAHERRRAASRAPTSTSRLGKKGKKVCAPGRRLHRRSTRSDNEFEAVMAYFHIDRTRLYVDSLGLSKPLRAKPQKVFARRDPRRQLVLLVDDPRAGARDRRGRRRRGRRRDHPRVRPLAPGPGVAGVAAARRQGATMGEGFGDYMAAAMSALTTGGSPFDTCIFDWDGISYSPTGTCGRRADRTLRRQEGARRSATRRSTASARSGRRLCSGCATALGNDAGGQSIMDRVVLEANFLLHQKSNFKRRRQGADRRRPDCSTPARTSPHDRGDDATTRKFC